MKSTARSADSLPYSPLFCNRPEDHPVSPFGPATPPKEGNLPWSIPLLRRGGGRAAGVVRGTCSANPGGLTGDP